MMDLDGSLIIQMFIGVVHKHMHGNDHFCIRSLCVGLWSIDELVRYNHLYDYDFALASVAQAISTILWVLLLIVPLIQVNVTTCSIPTAYTACMHTHMYILVRAFVESPRTVFGAIICIIVLSLNYCMSVRLCAYRSIDIVYACM